MKKRIIAVIVILAVLVALFFIGTGFQKRMDVVLVDYSVSEDGTEITLDVGIPTSTGYIRGFKDNGGGVKPHYLTFFSTFGGINSPIGAEHSFQLELTSDDTEIYFNRPEGGYELILVKDEETGQWLRPSGIGEENNTIFEATILEIRDNYFLVEPVEGSQELNNADLITVPMKNIGTAPQPNVGDIIEIAYNGEIAESYPAQITEVYGIKVVKEAEQWDLIPMVMVNGELYIDTGHESTVEARCGVMDGEITSEVDGSEKPTKDNQSNFGTGYGYQYGSQEGIIDININEKWWEDAKIKFQNAEIFSISDMSEKMIFDETCQSGMEAVVVEKSFAGGLLRVVLKLADGTEVIANRHGIDAGVQPGQKVTCHFDAENAVLVDLPSETESGAAV